MIAAAIGVLVPALLHGTSYGSFDLLSKFGLTQNVHVTVHNSATRDQISELIPWSTLAWTQVHQGQLPLWNPYTALGMPLAFNWQSAAFSLPTLIGYLVPLPVAYTVQVAVTLIIAGVGAYVLGRVLGMGVLAATFTGTAFELSGPMVGWLGWPVASVMSWAGWLFAACLLLIRGRRRARSIAFLALTLAGAIYAGQPDILALLLPMLALFAFVLLFLRTPWLHGEGPILRPVLDLALAVMAGVGLAAPLALPGLQLTAHSIRASGATDQALSLHDLIHLAFQGYDGGATAGQIAAYVGVIVLVLSLLGLVLRWRQPEVVAFTVVIVASGALAFTPPLISLLDRVPVLGAARWDRAVLPMIFGLCVLGGLGVDVLIRSFRRREVQLWLGGGFVVAALCVLLLWLERPGPIPSSLRSMRAGSFVWPVAAAALGLMVVLGLAFATRTSTGRNSAPGRALSRSFGTWSAAILLAGETAFLIAVGSGPLPSSASFFTPTHSVRELQGAVGSSLVGFGLPVCLLPQLGILQEANDAFKVREFAAYDPMMSRSYASSLTTATGRSPFIFASNTDFCPGITTSKVARLYGVAFVLEPRGHRGPRGGLFDRRVGNEDLYRIPGAATATLTSAPAAGPLPPSDSLGRPVAIQRRSPRSLKMQTDATGPQVLRLRLTDVPGWNATIDGRPLQLHPFAGVMLQARIPPGRHTVELTYWPKTFTLGLLLALISVLGLGLVPLWEKWRHPRDRRRDLAP